MEKEELELPKPFQPSYNIIKKMDQLNKNGEIISHFIGLNSVHNLFYIYLFKKYKHHCFINNENTFLTITINPEILSISTQIKIELYKYIKMISDCIKNKKKIIIIPLLLLIINKNKTMSIHANVMIYRKSTNQIEHFEPYGKNFKGVEDIDLINNLIKMHLQYIVNAINEKIKSTITFIHSSEVCLLTDFGFQAFEEESSIEKILDIESSGYCVAWSMFFTELCLKNPKYSSREIIEMVDDQIIKKFEDAGSRNDYLRKLIRGYANVINEKLLKYFSLLYGEDITIEKIKIMYDTKNSKSIITINNIINELIKFDSINFNSTLKILEKKISKINKQIEKNEEKKNLAKRIQNIEKITQNASSLLKIKLYYEKEITKLHKFNKFKVSSKSIDERSCPEGKELNPLTNRCIKIKAIKTVKIVEKDDTDDLELAIEKDIAKTEIVCPAGKMLNPLTKRCIKIKATKTVKICPAGKELNPLTNRCKNIKTKKNTSD